MDIFKIFRSCFYCKRRLGKVSANILPSEPLLCVEHPGYNTTYHYFHRSCLQRVLSEPENNVEFLDTAIQISDQEERDKQNEAGRIERYRRQIRRANEIVQRQRTSTNEDLNELIQQAKNSIEEKQVLDINNKQDVIVETKHKKDNKLRNIFGD